MERRRFDHLHMELSLAVGALVPRYPLWLRLSELGMKPDGLSREGVLAFRRDHLRGFLASERLSISPRAERRLTRTLARFDPQRPAPEETLERLAGGAR